MIRGLYTSGWSMLANTRKLDVITNNMANVNTTAYKKDTVVFESFPSVLTKRINDTRSPLNPSGNIGRMQLSSDVGEIYTYYTQGQLSQTGSKLDFAISDDSTSPGASPAFFTIGMMDGNNNDNINEYYKRQCPDNCDQHSDDNKISIPQWIDIRKQLISYGKCFDAIITELMSKADVEEEVAASIEQF